MGISHLQLTPIFSTTDSTHPVDGVTGIDALNGLPPYTYVLWNEFFKNHYTYVRHKDVISGGDANYFIKVFKEEFDKWQNDRLPDTEFASTLASITEIPQGNLDSLSNSQLDALSHAIKDWKEFLLSEPDFAIRSRNVMYWVFRIMQNTLNRLEDLIISRSQAIRLPQKSIELTTEILQTDERAKFKIPEKSEPQEESQELTLARAAQEDALAAAQEVDGRLKELNKQRDTGELKIARNDGTETEFINGKVTEATDPIEDAEQKESTRLTTVEYWDEMKLAISNITFPLTEEDVKEVESSITAAKDALEEDLDNSGEADIEEEAAKKSAAAEAAINKVNELAGEGSTPGQNKNTFETAHYNSAAKVFRDQIRTHRHMAQQKLGNAAMKGAIINTALTDQANILKAISTLNSKLIRSVISRK